MTLSDLERWDTRNAGRWNRLTNSGQLRRGNITSCRDVMFLRSVSSLSQRAGHKLSQFYLCPRRSVLFIRTLHTYIHTEQPDFVRWSKQVRVEFLPVLPGLRSRGRRVRPKRFYSTNPDAECSPGHSLPTFIH